MLALLDAGTLGNECTWCKISVVVCVPQLLCQNIMGLISSPLRIIVAMVMLYFELGFASLVALGVLLLLMPTQARACPVPVRRC